MHTTWGLAVLRTSAPYLTHRAHSGLSGCVRLGLGPAPSGETANFAHSPRSHLIRLALHTKHPFRERDLAGLEGPAPGVLGDEALPDDMGRGWLEAR